MIFKVFVEHTGLLQVQFDVEERFQHQLKSAVLTLPYRIAGSG